MRCLIQRVQSASVTVQDQITGQIGRGLLLLTGIHHNDTPDDLAWMADKVARLRIFPDDEGKMNRSVQDIGGAVLVVSQFTLYGDASKGTRPSFIESARPEVAIPLYERFIENLRNTGLTVETGIFGAMMQVALINDGPVTIWLERP